MMRCKERLGSGLLSQSLRRTRQMDVSCSYLIANMAPHDLPEASRLQNAYNYCFQSISIGPFRVVVVRATGREEGDRSGIPARHHQNAPHVPHAAMRFIAFASVGRVLVTTIVCRRGRRVFHTLRNDHEVRGWLTG